VFTIGGWSRHTRAELEPQARFSLRHIDSVGQHEHIVARKPECWRRVDSGHLPRRMRCVSSGIGRQVADTRNWLGPGGVCGSFLFLGCFVELVTTPFIVARGRVVRRHLRDPVMRLRVSRLDHWRRAARSIVVGGSRSTLVPEQSLKRPSCGLDGTERLVTACLAPLEGWPNRRARAGTDPSMPVF